VGKVPKTTAFDIVAIAASAGGVTALARLLSELPKLGAIVVIVQHVDPRHRSLMPQVIGRRSPLPVEHVEDETQLAPDHVYLAPPDHHLLVNRKGRATLTDSELVNFVRPSADLLFESVAAAYGDRAIAVVLTGSGRDGAMGVTAAVPGVARQLALELLALWPQDVLPAFDGRQDRLLDLVVHRGTGQWNRHTEPPSKRLYLPRW